MDDEMTPQVGDVWCTTQEIKGILTIPDGAGGRVPFDIPADATFTLIRWEEPTSYSSGRWWVVSFNGFSPWTSVNELIRAGYLKLLTRHKE